MDLCWFAGCLTGHACLRKWGVPGDIAECVDLGVTTIILGWMLIFPVPTPAAFPFSPHVTFDAVDLIFCLCEGGNLRTLIHHGITVAGIPFLLGGLDFVQILGPQSIKYFFGFFFLGFVDQFRVCARRGLMGSWRVSDGVNVAMKLGARLQALMLLACAYVNPRGTTGSHVAWVLELSLGIFHCYLAVVVMKNIFKGKA